MRGDISVGFGGRLVAQHGLTVKIPHISGIPRTGLDKIIKNRGDVIARRDGRPVFLFQFGAVFLQLLAKSLLGTVSLASPAPAKIGGHGLNDAKTHRGIGKNFFHFLGEIVELIFPLHSAQESRKAQERGGILHLGKHLGYRRPHLLGFGIGTLPALGFHWSLVFDLGKKLRRIIQIEPRIGRALAPRGDAPPLISAHDVVQRGLDGIGHHIGIRDLA